MALDTNLESVWKMEEASGNRADSVGSNTLVDVNTVGQGAAKIGSASADLELGNSEYFYVEDNASLSPGDEDWAFCGWFKMESSAADHDLVAKWGDNGMSQAAFLARITGDKLQFLVSANGSSATAATHADTLSDDTWYFFFVYHDSVNNLISCNINNGTAVTTAHSTGIHNSDQRFTIGAHNPTSPTAYFDGLIDAVYYWKGYIPTSTERGELYNSGNGLDLPQSTAHTKEFNETITMSDTIVKASAKTFAETLTITDSIIRAIARSLSDTVTITDTLTKIKGYFRTLSDEIIMSDTFSYIQGRFRTFSETVTMSDSIIKGITRTLSDTINITDSIVQLRGYFKTFTDTINISDMMWRFKRRFLTFTKQTPDSGSWTEESPDDPTWTRRS